MKEKEVVVEKEWQQFRSNSSKSNSNSKRSTVDTLVTRELSKLFNNKIFVIGELRVREDFKKVQICDTCQKSRGEVQTKTIFYKIWEIWTKILRKVGEIIFCHKSVTKIFCVFVRI